MREQKGPQPTAPSRDDPADVIVAELAPFFARHRQALAQRWCSQSVSMTHLHVVSLLDLEGSLPISRLAEALDVSLPSTSGIVDRMEERGLVERVRDESDRRLVHVCLRPAGRAVIEELEVVRRQHLRRVIHELSPEQQERCVQAVRDVKEAFARVRATEAERPARNEPVRSDA